MRAVATALVLLAGGHAVDAQPADKVPRIGFLYFGSGQSGVGADRYAAFLDGMRERGYIDGKTVAVEARFADSRAERVPGLADELMRLKVDLIVATGSPVYRVLQRMSVPVPVVVTVTVARRSPSSAVGRRRLRASCAICGRSGACGPRSAPW